MRDVPITASGFVERELFRLEVALRDGQHSERYDRLYVAQQALRWALEPSGFASPYDMVMGIQAEPTGCSADPHPLPS